MLRLTGVVFKRLPGIAVPEVLPGERGTDPRPQVTKVTDGVWDQSAYSPVGNIGDSRCLEE